jgi:uroporphyrinogen-III synthase
MVITAQVYAMNPVAACPWTCAKTSWRRRDRRGAVLFAPHRRHLRQAYLGRLGERCGTRLGVLCLSETVAEPLIDAHFVRVGLADHPSEEAMMSLALSFCRDQNAS